MRKKDVVIAIAAGIATFFGTSGVVPLERAAATRLAGVTPDGREATITWGNDSADVTLRDRSGAATRIWFDGKRGARQSISSDVSPFRSTWKLELLRRALTSDFHGMSAQTHSDPRGTVTDYDSPQGGSIAVRRAPDGSVQSMDAYGTTLTNLRFSGALAVEWTAVSDVLPSFRATRAPVTVSKVPAMPLSPWSARLMSYGPLRATVGGRPVSVGVDTAHAGISVSTSLMKNAAAGDTVRLANVEIAGRKSATVFARVTDQARFDLYAGIELFPGALIAISRDGRGALRHGGGCRSGAALLPYQGTALVLGPDAKGRVVTLLDTRHAGGPETRAPQFPIPGTSRCDAAARTIAFGGQIYGRDRFCNTSPGIVAEERDYDVVLGLDSLQAANVLIDLQTERLCVERKAA
jgi:hypothetical protein